MWPVLLRAGLAVGTVVGAAVAGRKALDKKIEKKLLTATEEAVILAEAELDRSVKAVLRERSIRFAKTMAVKFALLGIVALSYWAELLTLRGLRFSIIALGIGYIVYDLRQVLPRLLPALAYARLHKFSVRSMITDTVAAAAFERAREEVAERLSGDKHRRWIALSSFTPEGMSHDIAEAVAEVARHASYDKVMPRALMFIAATVALSMVYTGLAWLVASLG
ncbi:hypothetical protein [Parvularcula lutaonensis]|uniref:Type II secretion system protein GspF domain-containing protein n=1 Tax=Parvularcula lutaonensis TaxID=491923 RepID=A0ABV7M7H0_9PROT|nr:hypothetical protein [Parvularcula lutaonensis]GGY41989.1 hypothetical protein GCM10007148_08270 [Parvularcula lutaonensis]